MSKDPDDARPPPCPSCGSAASETAESIDVDAWHVQIDIACPRCEYNLRGLLGPIVTCPECGLESAAAELATRQWTKPWYKAPGFNTLAWPGVCAFVGGFFVLPVLLAHMAWNGFGTYLVELIGVGIWGLLMARAYRVFNSTLGVWFALAIHILIAAFLLATIVLGAAIVNLILIGLNHSQRLWVIAIALVAGLLLLFLLWISRRIERAIAQVCIRQYLRRTPIS